MVNRQPQYRERKDVLIKNVVTNERTRCDIINEESIDGKLFYVVRMGPRIFKLAKEGYSLVKS